MINLFGVYECRADEKGRLMFPVAFKGQLKAALKQGFVIKQSIFSKSLELYPMNTWNEMMKEVNKLNRFVKKNVEFIRMFNYRVQEVSLDGNSRLLIPKDLLGLAGIKKDIVLSAAGNMIEVWDKKTYEKFIKEQSSNFEKLAEDVMGNQNNTDKNGIS